MFSGQKVILLVGPAGSGKTTLGQRIAENPGWVHVSEDDSWVTTGQNHGLRTPEGRALVEPHTLKKVTEALEQGKNVVLDFLEYENPPVNIGTYTAALKQLGVTTVVRVLRPTVEAVMERKKQRGRPTETDLDVQRKHTEHQIKCLQSPVIEPEWVIDSSGKTAEETYAQFFLPLVQKNAPRAVSSPQP